METILIALNVVMAGALWWKSGCKRFAAIQCAQLLEIPAMHYWPAFGVWREVNQWNILIEVAAVCVARRVPVARWMMLLHAFLKVVRYVDIDCDFQMKLTALTDAIYVLNCVILATLLAYALHKPILRLKDAHARSRCTASRSNRPSHQRPSPSTAAEVAY